MSDFDIHAADDKTFLAVSADLGPSEALTSEGELEQTLTLSVEGAWWTGQPVKSTERIAVVLPRYVAPYIVQTLCQMIAEDYGPTMDAGTKQRMQALEERVVKARAETDALRMMVQVLMDLAALLDVDTDRAPVEVAADVVAKVGMLTQQEDKLVGMIDPPHRDLLRRLLTEESNRLGVEDEGTLP